MKTSVKIPPAAAPCCLLCLLMLLSGCSVFSRAGKPAPPPAEEEPEKPLFATLTLAAVGDNLIHDNIYRQARERAGGRGFDFGLAYEGVRPLIAGHDVAFVNQESPIAEDVAPLSSYPRFCSPKAVGEKLVDLGFNVVNIANNHMLDKNEEGLIAHMDFWDSQDILLQMGCWRTEEAMERPLTLTVRDITLGFVAMTEHTNGLTLSAGSPLRYLRTDDWEAIERQVRLADAASDFQIASVHWGIEGTSRVSDAQRELARKLCDAGVDLIIGHHPHTLQPAEWLDRADGSRTLVLYSLGNFISSQSAAPNLLGAVADLVIMKNTVTGETGLVSARLHPIVTQYDGSGRDNVRLIPLDGFTDGLASAHGVRENCPGFSPSYLRGLLEKVIAPEFLEKPAA